MLRPFERSEITPGRNPNGRNGPRRLRNSREFRALSFGLNLQAAWSRWIPLLRTVGGVRVSHVLALSLKNTLRSTQAQDHEPRKGYLITGEEFIQI